MVELVVVWTWHAPLLHHAARVGLAAFVMEQASFLGAGLLLWLSVFGGGTAVVALVFTAIHMTLLGALFALAPRPLYSHTLDAVATVQDQQIGGAVMIIVGGAAYLSGGLWLTRQLLERRVTAGLERLE
jgi:putative membrane protein